jgi:uncharacterized protein (TIGR03435 family)
VPSGRFSVLIVAALMLTGSPFVRAQQQTPSQNSATAPEPDLSGTWQGTAAIGGGQGRLLKVSRVQAKYKAVLYSIDQGWQMVANTFDVHGNTVAFAITGIGLTYTGTLSAGGDAIAGSVTENGETHPLNLSRVADVVSTPVTEPPRPMRRDAKPKFDVVTIKRSPLDSPGKGLEFRGRQLIARDFNVDDMIMLGYGVHTKQIIGAPEWFNSELFDVEGVPDTAGVSNSKQMGNLMQDLLSQRFGLTIHHEQRQLSVYAITLAKSGPKMQVSSAGPDDQPGFAFRGFGDLSVHNMSIADFAGWMQATVTDRPIVDQTGLKDRYDFTLKWTPDDSQFAQFRSTGKSPPAKEDPNAPPALNDAAQQQLGLRIQSVKAMDDVIVIDRANHPSAN